MTLQVITIDKIGAGAQVDLNTNDDAFIVAGVTVGSTGTFAITSAGDNQTVNLQGTAIGASAAIDLGGNGNSQHQVLTVGENAYVGGFGTTTGAVTMRGYSNEAHNAGTIHGEGYGIRMLGNGA